MPPQPTLSVVCEIVALVKGVLQVQYNCKYSICRDMKILPY